MCLRDKHGQVKLEFVERRIYEFNVLAGVSWLFPRTAEGGGGGVELALSWGAVATLDPVRVALFPFAENGKSTLPPQEIERC